jgi:serine/threonine protein kinase
MTGQTMFHYRETEELGSGGMGVVYKAQERNLGRSVALRVLAGHLLSSDDHKQRFLREAKAAAGLEHLRACHREIDLYLWKPGHCRIWKPNGIARRPHDSL